MKKTAVEWLIDMLVTENEITLKGENFKLFDQAKEMEKQQMRDASCPYVGGWEDDEFKYWYDEQFKNTEQ
jgi:hypothetical protein